MRNEEEFYLLSFSELLPVEGWQNQNVFCHQNTFIYACTRYKLIVSACFSKHLGLKFILNQNSPCSRLTQTSKMQQNPKWMRAFLEKIYRRNYSLQTKQNTHMLNKLFTFSILATLVPLNWFILENRWWVQITYIWLSGCKVAL